METTNINANLNSSQCIQEVSNIGSTIYMNICNDTSHVVPWGTGDWGVTLLSCGLIIFLIFLFKQLSQNS